MTGSPEVDFLGPQEVHEVVVGGRLVPFLRYHKPSADSLAADPTLDSRVFISLDGRFGLEIPVEVSDAVINFVANAIAVGMGYSCHPTGDDEPVKSNSFPRVHMIVSADSGPSDMPDGPIDPFPTESETP